MTGANSIDEIAIRGPQVGSMVNRAARSPTLPLVVLYALMHGGILFVPGGVFWDDWTLYRASPATIARMFEDAGAVPGITQLHLALLGLGMWSYKVLTFALWLGTGLLLNRILARNRFFTGGARFAIVLLFLVLPFNAARIAAIDFPYTLCCFLFFLAWELMDRRRVTALVLFAASFITPSLLVFYALPILDMAYRGGHLASLRAVAAFVRRRLDFLLLPLLFFAVRMATFAPSGTYANYNNNYDLANVRRAVTLQLADARDLPLWLDPLLALVLLPLAWLVLRPMGPALRGDAIRPGRLLACFALGVAAFVLGGFPYWILGHIPTFTEWTSRHQLLLPLGTALMLVALLWFLPGRARTAALSVLVAASLSFGIGNAYAFWVDWKKQRTIAELMAREPAIAQASFVVFLDHTQPLNAIGRSYRVYEWNGLMEEVFHSQTRFGAGPADVKSYVLGRHDALMKEQYKAKDHRRNPEAGALLVEIHAVPDRPVGRSIWRWPPLPQLALKTSTITRDRLALVRQGN